MAPNQTQTSLPSDLQGVLDAQGALDPEGAVRIAVQAARDLCTAHESGLLHGDVKPRHLLLERDGLEIAVKVGGFGITRHRPYPEPSSHAAASRLALPDYAAPEQLRAGKPIDERADVWGLGATLYQMLCGVAPFSHLDSATALIEAACNDDVPALQGRAPWIEPGLAQVVHGALSRDPEQRPPSMAQFAERLLPFAGDDELLEEAHLAPVSNELKQRVAPRAEPPSSPHNTPPSPPSSAQRALQLMVSISPSAVAGMANLARGGRGGTSLPAVRPPRASSQAGPRTNSWLFLTLLILIVGGLSMGLGYALHHH